MDVFWFWVLIVLLFLSVAVWPTWPYTHRRWIYRRPGAWRYAPSGLAAGLLVLMLLFVWLGLLAIAVPWQSPVPVEM